MSLRKKCENVPNSNKTILGKNNTCVKILGEGGFGKVYLHKGSNNKFYAIKVLQRNIDTESDNIKEMKLLEFISNKGCKYNITCLFNVIKTPNKYFIITNFTSKKTLFDLISSKNIIKSIELFEIIKQLLNALSFLHQHNIAHKDIKPENIIYNKQKNKIELIDFGLSCHQSKSKCEISGTPLYYSIDILKNYYNNYIPIDIFISGDVWALGIVIYVLIYKTYPFNNTFGDNSITKQEIKKRIKELKNTKIKLNLSPLQNNDIIDIINTTTDKMLEPLDKNRPTSFELKNQYNFVII
jgi:serine/threonine protein kinase